MSRTDNYPDDIRSYDHDPRSPFYDDGGLEDAEESLFEEIRTSLVENDGDFDRDEVDEQLSEDYHLELASDIIWLLYSNPTLLTDKGYSELQGRIETAIDDEINKLASKYVQLRAG